MFRRLYELVPPAVRAHPLGLLAMWGWTMLGVALLIPTFGGDPKPWPDLFWPALLSNAPDEVFGMAALGVGMIVSGSMFLVGQSFLPRLWAEKLRWGALWGALFVNLYVVSSILIKAFRDPDQVAPYWPISLTAWAMSLTLFAFAIPAAAIYGYGAIYRGADRRRAPRNDH